MLKPHVIDVLDSREGNGQIFKEKMVEGLLDFVRNMHIQEFVILNRTNTKAKGAKSKIQISKAKWENKTK